MTTRLERLFCFSALVGFCALGCQQAPRVPEKAIEYPPPLKTSDGFSTSRDNANPQVPAKTPQTSQTAGYPMVVPNDGPPLSVKQELNPPPASAVVPLKSADKLPVVPVAPQIVNPVWPAPPPSPPSARNQGVVQAGGSNALVLDDGAATGAGREPVVQALADILKDDRSRAIGRLKNYDPATQTLLLEMLRPLAIIAQKKLCDLSSLEVTRLIDQLVELLQSLQPRSSLTIDQACFCQSVKSFGDYEPLPEGHVFLASMPNRPGERVTLYVQLRNFASVPRDGAFETRLASSVEIHNAKGEKIWNYNFEDRQHPVRRRAPLHDYFNNYTFNVPYLPPGNYVLTIQIADETIPEARREPATKSLEFRVGATVAAQR